MGNNTSEERRVILLCGVKLHQRVDQSQCASRLRRSVREPIRCHHDSRKERRRSSSSSTVENYRGSGDQGNLKVSTEFSKDTRLFLILHTASRIFQHGGGSSRDRRSPQSAPDIRETCRLLQRLTDGLHTAHICRFTVSGQPGVVGFRLQHLFWAAGTKKTEAHTLESGRKSTSQVSLRKNIPHSPFYLGVTIVFPKRKPGHCSSIYGSDTPKDIDLLTTVICRLFN